jgi:hypothetical protein
MKIDVLTLSPSAKRFIGQASKSFCAFLGDVLYESKRAFMGIFIPLMFAGLAVSITLAIIFYICLLFSGQTNISFSVM